MVSNPGLKGPSGLILVSFEKRVVVAQSVAEKAPGLVVHWLHLFCLPLPEKQRGEGTGTCTSVRGGRRRGRFRAVAAPARGRPRKPAALGPRCGGARTRGEPGGPACSCGPHAEPSRAEPGQAGERGGGAGLSRSPAAAVRAAPGAGGGPGAARRAEDGAGRMEILMTVSRIASACIMVSSCPGPAPRAGPRGSGRSRERPGGPSARAGWGRWPPPAPALATASWVAAPGPGRGAPLCFGCGAIPGPGRPAGGEPPPPPGLVGSTWGLAAGCCTRAAGSKREPLYWRLQRIVFVAKLLHV